jgi:hypothetical protein
MNWSPDDYYTLVDLRDPGLLSAIREFVSDAERQGLFFQSTLELNRVDFPSKIFLWLRELMPFPISDAGVFKNEPGWNYPIHRDKDRWASMNLLLVDPDPRFGANIYDKDQKILGTIPYEKDQWMLLNTSRYHSVFNNSDTTRYVVSVGCTKQGYTHIRQKFEHLGMVGPTTWRDQRHLAVLTNWEKSAMQKIVLALPQNPVVVEVGSYMGGSCVIMAMVRSDSEIHGFDMFELDTVNKRGPGFRPHVFDRLLNQNNAPRTLENVRKITAPWPNIHLHRAESPNGIEWNRPIDLYFEDGCHRDPALSANVDFWEPFINPGGYLVFHDYRPHVTDQTYKYKFPDVESAVDRLITRGYSMIYHIHGMVILRKPNNKETNKDGTI